MQDDFIPKGQPKSAKPDAGNAPTIPMPVYGIVKDNFDETRQGSIRVFIADGTGKDPNVKENWARCFPLGFYGRTVGDAPKTGFGTYKTNPASYGMWHSPPDIGTKVVCVFVNGDPNYGYYLGGVYDPDAMHMLPAIGGYKNVLMNEAEGAGYGGAVVLPVTNLNDNSDEAAAPSKYIEAPKPVHSYVASILNQQGLIRDPIRGVISTSSQREAASRVGWGVSTPGRPIYQGGFDDESIAAQLSQGGDPESFKVVARRGGHSIIMDDGDLIGRNQLVRIRTALGHQITMSDDGQTLFIIHSNGQSYVELGKEGTVDIYATNSFNVRTQGDLNLHADNNINIHANKNLNIRAENIQVQAEGTYSLKVLKDYSEAIGGKLTSLIGGAYAVKSGGQASMVSGAEAFVVGSKVNLNSGDPATTPENVENIKAFAQTDTLYDKEKGFMAAPGKLVTIVSRAPAHTPWANAGQGVDVQVDLGASSNLPEAPSDAVSQTNQAAAATAGPDQTPAVSSSAVQPSTSAVSKVMDRNTTSAVLGSIAQDAARNPVTAPAVAQGGGIVTAADGAKSAVVGQYGMTTQQLQSAGTIKPGSAALVDSLIQKGSSLSNAMPSTLFTGQAGAQNLTALSTNVTAQAAAVTTNMTNAQTALTNAGVITGKESATAVAGVIKAGATVGIQPTIDAVKGVGGVGGLTSTVKNAVVGGLTNFSNSIKGAASKALGAIGSGNLAGQLADGLTSGLGSIKDSLAGLSASKGLSSIMDQAKGVAASAFDAIKNAFPKMPAGVPVDVAQVAKDAAQQAEAAAGTVAGPITNAVSAATNKASGLLGAAKTAAGGLQNQLSGGAAALGKPLSAAGGAVADFQNATKSILNTPAKPTVAGVLSQVAGTAAALSSNSKTGAIAGAVSGIAGALNTQGTSLTNTLTQGLQSAAQGAVTGALNNALDKATGGLAGKVMTAATALNAITGTTPTGAVNAFGTVSSMLSGGKASGITTAIAGGVSTMASGLSNLPGGLSAVGALKNNATSIVGSVAGGLASGLAGGISGALGKLNSKAGALGSAAASLGGLASDIAGKATAALNNIKPPTLDAAAALAKTGLPSGIAAQLQSQISAIGSGGGVPVGMPVIAINTTNRAEITEQTDSLLGDPSIPKPNLLGEVSQASTDSYMDYIRQQNEKAKACESLMKDFMKKNDKADKLSDKVKKARKKLPQGDPQLTALEDEYRTVYKDYSDALDAWSKCRKDNGLD